ncbi:hypothetical protein B0T21DRAFT_293268 [Apiosordaria backusii]|uniref:Uncharacterized protein n=1 Tax=Apiosordaria backusii TaxID=314023 RepID=A0AA40B2V4_9PEZI|nr:hypothetical protein B0T21DRAFT_293268 [Apiosordaria backusii]
MDFLNKVAGEALKTQQPVQEHQQQHQQQQQTQTSGGLLGSIVSAAAQSTQPATTTTQQQPQQTQTSGASGLLGSLVSAAGQSTTAQQQPQQQQSGADALLNKLHGVVGGGPESEKKEDSLDKAIDLVQEHVFKAGAQANESAAEQAKDKFIADSIRDGYQKATGKDFPIAAKKEEENKITSGLGGLAGKLFK